MRNLRTYTIVFSRIIAAKQLAKNLEAGIKQINQRGYFLRQRIQDLQCSCCRSAPLTCPL